MAKLAANSMEGKAEGFLKRIENVMSDGESAKGKYLSECKKRAQDIKEIYTEAKDAGVTVKSLKGVVKRRQLEKKIEAIPAGLDIDEASTYPLLVEALGDLGKAAAKAAGHDPDDKRDFRGNGQKQAEKERADEAALGQVGRA